MSLNFTDAVVNAIENDLCLFCKQQRTEGLTLMGAPCCEQCSYNVEGKKLSEEEQQQLADQYFN